jgi:hypothetical protein
VSFSSNIVKPLKVCPFQLTIFLGEVVVACEMDALQLVLRWNMFLVYLSVWWLEHEVVVVWLELMG